MQLLLAVIIGGVISGVVSATDDEVGEIQIRRNCAARCFVKCMKTDRQADCSTKCQTILDTKFCKGEACFNLCRDPDGIMPANVPPPASPAAMTASLDEHSQLSAHWESVDGADAYVIAYSAGGHHNEQFVAEAELLRLDVPPALLCDGLDVRVASISLAGGVGELSPAVRLRAAEPGLSFNVRSLTLEDKPYRVDGYESNRTVKVVLQYKIDEWILPADDLTISLFFLMISCKTTDLSMAVPESVLVENRLKRTFETELADSLMYLGCTYGVSVEKIHSKACRRDYNSAVKGLPARVELSCNTVKNCNRTVYPLYKGPVCGRTENLRVNVVNASKINWHEANAPITVNATFDYNLYYNRNVTGAPPLYYLVRYGHAVEHNTNDELKAMLGVTLVDQLGTASNCLSIQKDGTCTHYAQSNHSVLIANLTADALYGVMICAIMDARNLTLPPISVTERRFGIRTDRLQIHSADYRTVAVPENRVELLGWLVGGGALALAAFVALAAACAARRRRQRIDVLRKKLSIAESQQRHEQRYTELPKKADVWELERRNLIIYENRRLGAGAFGAVYLGRLIGAAKGSKDAQSALGVQLMRADNCEVAVKMLPEYADELSKSEFLREIALMKSLGYHERLVNMLACVTNTEPYCLVVEYCADGDLLAFLRQRCEYMLELDQKGIKYADVSADEPAAVEFDPEMIMTMRQLLQFAVQISYGLEYLSQKGFVHRDVAARNILVHNRQYAKIGDFGLCRFVYAQTANYEGNGGRLPVKWMSPEAIRDYEFTTKSDVWSFGVLMFEIITLGGTPYPGVQPTDILDYLESGKRLAKPDNCPDELYDIMSLCWGLQPADRPNFAAIRQRLAVQLEATADEYSYLRLDAQKDYYNVAKKELREQAGENVFSSTAGDESVTSL